MKNDINPSGKIGGAADLGRIASARRKEMGLTQRDLAGLTLMGERFIGELERGKPTLQFDKVVHVLNMLGIELLANSKGSAGKGSA